MKLLIQQHPEINSWLKRTEATLTSISLLNVHDYFLFFPSLLKIEKETKFVANQIRSQRNLFGASIPSVLFSEIIKWIKKDEILQDMVRVNKCWNHNFRTLPSGLYHPPYFNASWKISTVVELPCIPSLKRSQRTLFVHSYSFGQTSQINLLISCGNYCTLIFQKGNDVIAKSWPFEFSSGYLGLVKDPEDTKRNPMFFCFHKPTYNSSLFTDSEEEEEDDDRSFKLQKWHWIAEVEKDENKSVRPMHLALESWDSQTVRADKTPANFIAYSKQIEDDDDDVWFLNKKGRISSLHLWDSPCPRLRSQKKLKWQKNYKDPYSSGVTMSQVSDYVTLDRYNVYKIVQTKEKEFIIQIHDLPLTDKKLHYLNILLPNISSYALKLVRAFNMIIFVIYEKQRGKGKRQLRDNLQGDDIIHIYFPGNQKGNPVVLDVRSCQTKENKIKNIPRIQVEDLVLHENKIFILVSDYLVTLVDVMS
jgi:hypothetical protein